MKLFLDSVGGGAWPFVVGGAICLVHSDNERDSVLLTSGQLGDLLPRWPALLRGTGGAHEAARSRSNNRSVMPFDGLGRTRATLKEATRSLLCGGQARFDRCVPGPKGLGNRSISSGSSGPSWLELGLEILPHEPGIPSKRESAACVDYVPALCTHRPSLLPIE